MRSRPCVRGREITAHPITGVRPKVVRIVKAAVMPLVYNPPVRAGEQLLVLPEIVVIPQGPICIVIDIAVCVDRGLQDC